jgi:hypothetical protein
MPIALIGGTDSTLTGATDMFLILGLVLLAVWLIGFGMFRAIVGGLIHVVLVLAVIALAWHFVSTAHRSSDGGRSVSRDRGGAPTAAPAAMDVVGDLHGDTVVG